MCSVQCALAQSRKHSQGSDSLLPLAVSSKYDKEQLLSFVFQDSTAFSPGSKPPIFATHPLKHPK